MFSFSAFQNMFLKPTTETIALIEASAFENQNGSPWGIKEEYKVYAMTVLDQEERKLQADQSVGRQESPCSVGQIREKESKKAQNLSGRLVSSERRDLMRKIGGQSQCEDCERSLWAARGSRAKTWGLPLSCQWALSVIVLRSHVSQFFKRHLWINQ